MPRIMDGYLSYLDILRYIAPSKLQTDGSNQASLFRVDRLSLIGFVLFCFVLIHQCFVYFVFKQKDIHDNTTFSYECKECMNYYYYF